MLTDKEGISYFRVIITCTGKEGKDSWRIFEEIEEKFADLAAVKNWIKEKYGRCKKVLMYRDGKNGEAIKTGYIYCFRNKDISHNSKEWFQRDWVEIRTVREKIVA